MSLSAFNLSLCHLSPFHLVLCPISRSCRFAGILPQQSLFKRCHTHLNIIKTTAGINMISVQAMNLRSPC